LLFYMIYIRYGIIYYKCLYICFLAFIFWLIEKIINQFS
jgi:hypothetical protein